MNSPKDDVKNGAWHSISQEILNLETSRLLGNTTRSSCASTLLLALIIVQVAYGRISTVALVGWVLALATMFVVRFYLQHAAVAWLDHSTQKALARFRILIGLTGSIWALGELLILYLGRDIFSYQDYVFLTFVGAGYLVGAILALAMDKPTMLLCALPSVAPVTIACVNMSEHVAVSTFLALLLFVVYVFAAGLRQTKNIRDNIVLRLQATASGSQFQRILNSSPIAVGISDMATDEILFTSQRYDQLIERHSDRKKALQSLLNETDYKNIFSQLKRDRPVSDHLIRLDNGGSKAWVLASFNPFYFDERQAVLSWYYDITERKNLEEQVSKLAYQDALTLLPSRALFDDLLEKALNIAERDKKRVGILYIDLDKFKPVNDKYGHRVGDMLLVQAAERMLQSIRKADTVARLGGDEFGAILLIEKSEDAYKVAEAVRSALEEEFIVDGNRCAISASIGISIYPDHADTAEALINRADKAMYQAKQKGRNTTHM